MEQEKLGAKNTTGLMMEKLRLEENKIFQTVVDKNSTKMWQTQQNSSLTEFPKFNINLNNKKINKSIPVKKNEKEDTSCSNLLTEKLRRENTMLKAILLSSKHQQSEMGDAVSLLQSQLLTLIMQYKLLKSKNIVLQEKLNAVSNSRICNSSYQPYVRTEMETCDQMDEQKSEQSLESELFEEKKKRLIQEPRERSQSKSGTEESIDEGYADGSLLACTSANLPSPPLINPGLMSIISSILTESQDFLKPIEEGLNELQLKMKTLQQESYLQDSDRLSLATDYNNQHDSFFSASNFNSI